MMMMTEADGMLNVDLCARVAVKVRMKAAAMMDGDECCSSVPMLSV